MGQLVLDKIIRQQPKGARFLASAHSVDRIGRLYSMGLRKGDLVKCHMLNNFAGEYLVDVEVFDKTLSVSNDTEKYYTRLAYERELEE